jgi:archaellum biogenesis ATPase FlaH
MPDRTHDNRGDIQLENKIEPVNVEGPDPGELLVEEILQADYEAWQKEELQQKLLYEERQKWNAAMPHKNLIRMDKMKDCPHQEPIPILENIIYPGALTTISADPKAGKTTLLFNMLAQAISEGKDFLGLKTTRTTTVYASEQPFQSLNSQVNRLPGCDKNEHVWFIPYEFNYLEIDKRNADTGQMEKNKVFLASWEEQVRFWQSKVREIQAGLLIIDTFSAFALFKGGEAYDAGPVTTRLQQLKSIQTEFPDLAIVVCHHLRKEDQIHGKGVRSFSDIANSYAFRAAADMNVLLWKPSNKPVDKNLRNLTIEGRFIEEEFAISFRKEGDEFRACGPPVKPDPYLWIVNRVLEEPELNNLSEQALADELGVSRKKIRGFRKVYPKDCQVFQPVVFGPQRD